MKRLVIVGSSKALLSKENGNLIDSFDHIARFNGFVIKGYEKYVGSKIDIFCFIPVGQGAYAFLKEINPFHVKRANELWASRPLNICGREYKLVKRTIRQYNQKPIIHPTKELFFNLIEKCKTLQKTSKHPSTGMVAIEMILERFIDHEIYITGFDQFDGGHYYSNKPVKKCHPVIAEKIIIDNYIKDGRLKLL